MKDYLKKEMDEPISLILKQRLEKKAKVKNYLKHKNIRNQETYYLMMNISNNMMKVEKRGMFEYDN